MFFGKKAKAAKDAAAAEAREKEKREELKRLLDFLKAGLKKGDNEVDYVEFVRERFERIYSLQQRFPELVDGLGFNQAPPAECVYAWLDDGDEFYNYSYSKMRVHADSCRRMGLWSKLEKEWAKTHPDTPLRLEDIDYSLLIKVGYVAVAYLSFAQQQKGATKRVIKKIEEMLA